MKSDEPSQQDQDAPATRLLRPAHVIPIGVLLCVAVVALMASRSQPSLVLGESVVVDSWDAGKTLDETAVAELSGRVVDRDGAGIPEVSLLTIQGGRTLWTFSDQEGAYRLAGLERGSVELAVDHPLYEARQLRLDAGGAPQDIELSDPLAGRPVVPVMASAGLSGNALGPGGEPLVGYEVAVAPSADPDEPWTGRPRRAVTDDQGAYRLGPLPAGQYLVRLLPPGAHGGSWPNLLARLDGPEVVHQHTLSGDEVERLDLSSIAGEIRGDFRTSTGAAVTRALEGALVSAFPVGRDGDRHWDARRFPPTRTGARGEFRIPNLPPGDYRVELRSGPLSRESRVAVPPGGSVDPGF